MGARFMVMDRVMEGMLFFLQMLGIGLTGARATSGGSASGNRRHSRNEEAGLHGLAAERERLPIDVFCGSPM